MSKEKPQSEIEDGSIEDSTQDTTKSNPERPEEIGGQEGPEPTRYGDWEKNGIISDF